MFAIRTAAWTAAFFLFTLFFLVTVPFLTPFGGKTIRHFLQTWLDGHAWLCSTILGIRSHVTGVVPKGAHIIAVKHQSMYETIESARISHLPIMVMKRELSRIPLFGLVTQLYGVITVDRNSGSKAVRHLVNEGKRARLEQRSIVIFPEGTRVAVGQAPPVRGGFYALYRSLGLPVVPVAMDSGRLWGKVAPRAPGTIHFVIGETIPAGLKRDELDARVHAGINALEPAASTAKPRP